MIVVLQRMTLAAGLIFSATAGWTDPAVFASLRSASWTETALGDGVVARQARISGIFNSNQIISYVEADLSNPAVKVVFPYLTDKRQTTSQMIKSQYPDAVAGINGTYFALYPAKGGHTTYLKANNEVIPPQGKPNLTARHVEGALVIDQNKRMFNVEKLPSSGWGSLERHYTDIMANAPLLLKDGLIPGGNFKIFGNHCSNRHPRSAVGITADKKLILMTADGRRKESQGLSCRETAIVMQGLGCVAALNLDGGGSTTLYGKGKGVMNYPTDNKKLDHGGERPCANAIAVISQPGQTLALGADYLIESRPNGINGNRYRDKGFADTSTSVRAPGTSADIGTRIGIEPGAVAEWNPVISAPGKYKVSVSYPVIPPVDATTVIYTVSHAGGKQAFSIDQGMRHNQWITLGTFDFSPTGNGYVQMTAAPTGRSNGKPYAGTVKFEKQ